MSRKANKGDYISEIVNDGYEDQDTSEVLAVLNKPGKLDFRNGASYTCASRTYVIERTQGNFELVPEHDVTKVYRQ